MRCLGARWWCWGGLQADFACCATWQYGANCGSKFEKFNSIRPRVRVFQLHQNMRVSSLRQAGNVQQALELEQFVAFLKRVGEGTEQEYPAVGEFCIRIPADMCCGGPDASLNDLIEQVYGGLRGMQAEQRAQHIIERAILTPLNAQVDAINQRMMEWLATFDGGEEAKEYLSADSTLEEGDAAVYPVEKEQPGVLWCAPSQVGVARGVSYNSAEKHDRGACKWDKANCHSTGGACYPGTCCHWAVCRRGSVHTSPLYHTVRFQHAVHPA